MVRSVWSVLATWLNSTINKLFWVAFFVGMEKK